MAVDMNKPIDQLTDEELDELEKVKTYGQASTAPVQSAQAPSVPSPEQQQVRSQAPIQASEPPPRVPRVYGKPGGLRDTLFKNGPAPIEEPPQMSGVGEAEYWAQKGGNVAAGVMKAPISMIGGMAHQGYEAVLDANDLVHGYTTPEEVAQPGPAMPQAPVYNPAMEAAGNVLKSGAEFGAMFTPAAPLVGGYGLMSGLKQATEGEDSIARAEGIGHAGLGSALLRHSVAKRMPKTNQAGQPSTAADLPAGLRTPEMDLAGQALGKGLDIARAPLESLDAGLHAPGRFVRMVYDRVTGQMKPEVQEGVGAPPGPADLHIAERMATPVEEFDARFPPDAPDRLSVGQPNTNVPGGPNDIPLGDLEPPVYGVDPGEYGTQRNYTPEQQAVRTSRLQGVPKPEPVQPQIVEPVRRSVPEQLRRDRAQAPQASSPMNQAGQPRETPVAPVERPPNAPPDQAEGMRRLVAKKKAAQAPPPEPLFGGDTQPGEWSAPESSTVNSKAKRSLKKEKPQAPFQKAPAQTGAREQGRQARRMVESGGELSNVPKDPVERAEFWQGYEERTRPAKKSAPRRK